VAGPVIQTPWQQVVASLTSRPVVTTRRATIGPVGLVCDDTEQIRALLGALRYDGATFVDCNGTDCWIANLESLAGRIAGGELAGGIVIKPYAADAMLLAGKLKGLRPVQGVSSQAVAGGVRHFDANVLVMGHRTSHFGQMKAMINVFTAARTTKPANTVTDAVERFERT
jgi:ribose 5-phosphate isomerase RpiB